jgi:hypothetical protein
MGITTILQREDGTELGVIEDPSNVLHHILPADDDERYFYVNQIDWYGDTIFNYLQGVRLLKEWLTLEAKAQEAEALRVFIGIGNLIQILTTERHAYLKFIGD